MTDTNALLENLKNAGDFSKLQIHVIFNYIPFTKEIHETETYNQIAQENIKSSNNEDFIQSRIKDPNNKFNFTTETNDKVFVLNNHITKAQLESLLPELNKYVTTTTDILNSQGKVDSQRNSITLNKEGLSKEQEDLIKGLSGGARITKRQKKTPPKRNKHHTARKHS